MSDERIEIESAKEEESTNKVSEEMETTEQINAQESEGIEAETSIQTDKAETSEQVNTQETSETETEENAETAEASEQINEQKSEEVKAQADVQEKQSVETADVGITHEQEEKSGHVDYSRTFRSLSTGDVVDGIVVHIDKEGVLVDVGTKSEGIIRPGELTTRAVQQPEEVVAVGDKIDVYVMQPENDEGYIVLSKKRADFEKAWERLQIAYSEKKTISAMVTDRVKGGLVVDLGIRGFIPGSHVGSGNVKNLERYVGQSLPLKVIEVDRERRKVVLSHRLATEEERKKQRDETISSLKEGEVREGIVRRITDYGAFVDLGGIDGLLHVSEMSWTRVKHPSDVVKVGQKIQIVILRLNLEAGRVSLGMRQILPDPWSTVGNRWRVGDIIAGNISRLVPFGAFVQLDEGIEAIIPNAELSHRRVKKPEDVVSVGDKVEVKVIDVRPEERRMTLSIKQLQGEPEYSDYDTYRASSAASSEPGRLTLGDLLGDKLQGLTFVDTQAEKETKTEPVPSKKAKKTEADAKKDTAPTAVEPSENVEESEVQVTETETPAEEPEKSEELAKETETPAEEPEKSEELAEETASTETSITEDQPEEKKSSEDTPSEKKE